MAKKQSAQKVKRPLSPHLTIYKPQITSVLSITHRATGAFLTLGVILLSVWLIALAYSQEAYDWLSVYLNHPIARLLLLGWAFSIYFHLCNGIRHLFWDIGKGFELKCVTASGFTTLIVSLVLTWMTWQTALLKLGE